MSDFGISASGQGGCQASRSGPKGEDTMTEPIDALGGSTRPLCL